MKTKNKTTHTRSISPRFGLLGFLGLSGFFGFIQMQHNEMIPFTFFFFTFFGFFGFYYEGKMSNTLMDERFIANQNLASSKANKIGLSLMFLTAIISTHFGNNSLVVTAIFYASIGFAFALSIFLSQYLLYRYENDINSDLLEDGE